MAKSGKTPFIRPVSEDPSRYRPSGPTYVQKQAQRVLDGTGSADGLDYRFSNNWRVEDQNQRAIMEVAIELMYINGWTGESFLKSKRVQDQLTQLVIRKFNENGWMLNPQTVSTMASYGVQLRGIDDLSAFMDMASTDPQKYVKNVLTQLCSYGNGRAGHAFDPAISKKVDPEKPDSWPVNLNVVLDPSLRKHPTYHPNRWRAVNYQPPAFDTANMSWFQKALIPFAVAWTWFLSLTGKYQATVAVVSILFLWFVVATIF